MAPNAGRITCLDGHPFGLRVAILGLPGVIRLHVYMRAVNKRCMSCVASCECTDVCVDIGTGIDADLGVNLVLPPAGAATAAAAAPPPPPPPPLLPMTYDLGPRT